MQLWLSAAASIAVFAVAYGPLLAEFFRNQWAQPQYQFFPFVVGAFAWLLWRGCSQSRPREAAGGVVDRVVMVALLVAAWGLLALAYWSYSPWLAVISAILLVASLFVRVSVGWRVEYLWGIWALLWLMVPLPLGRDRDVVSWLQSVSSRLSSFFLDWLGVHHLMDGNVLILANKEFFVNEACSGIVSVMSVIACAVIYGVWRNRSPLHVVLLAVAGIGWATLMNVVRITTIAVAYENWGVDWSAGAPHETLGLIVFSVTFLLLVTTDYLLVALLAPIRTGEDIVAATDPIHFGGWLVSGWDWLQRQGAPQTVPASHARSHRSGGRRELWSRFALGIVPLLAFATLAGAQFTASQWLGTRVASAPQCLDRAIALDETLLPAQIGSLERVGFEVAERHRDDISGQYSRIFRYRDEHGSEFMMSCDFPFGPNWHELTVCYTSIGWVPDDKPLVHSAPAAGVEEWRYKEVRFERPEGGSGLLVYCVFDDHGQCLDPPTDSFIDDVWRSLSKQHRATQLGKQFQLQVWTTSAGPVGEEQAQTAKDLLLAVRDRVRQYVTKQGELTAANAP